MNGFVPFQMDAVSFIGIDSHLSLFNGQPVAPVIRSHGNIMITFIYDDDLRAGQGSGRKPIMLHIFPFIEGFPDTAACGKHLDKPFDNLLDNAANHIYMPLMKRILATLLISMFAVPALAWDNPNQSVAPFRNVSPDKQSRMTLENRRVQSVNGNTMTYNTGRETITLKADSAASRRFVEDVQSGRRTAREGVTLIPVRQSPFNTEYKIR
jgi:hypothetical protein